MPLAGDLRQYALSDVLRVVESGQRTGVLTLAHGNMRAAIYFGAGQLLFAERLGVGQTLARQLAQVGLLAPERFEAIFGVPFAQAAALTDAQVARGLISAHALSEEQLRAFASRDAVELLAVALHWLDGVFAFEDGVAPPPGRVPLPLPLGRLVALAQRQARSGPSSREVAPLAPEAIIDFAEVDPESATPVRLTREQWRLLTAVDGRQPLWAIVMRMGDPEQGILRLAAELLAAGVVVITGRAAQPAQTR